MSIESSQIDLAVAASPAESGLRAGASSSLRRRSSRPPRTRPRISTAWKDESGAFYFFRDDNLELSLEVLDGCDVAPGAFWVFASGLTDVEVDLRVEDLVAHEEWTYHHDTGSPFPPVLDTAALPASCP